MTDKVQIPSDQDVNKFAPQLDGRGREVVSPVSLVAAVNLRNVTLGERVRRYMKTPQFLQDQNDLDGYDPDEHDPEFLADMDENPMSRHELRFGEIAGRVRERKKQERAAEKQAAIDKENAERDTFRRRMRELKEEGDKPPLPLNSPAEQ